MEQEYKQIAQALLSAAKLLKEDTKVAADKVASKTAETVGERKHSMNGFKKPFYIAVGLVLTLVSFSVGIILSNQQVVNTQNNNRFDATDKKIAIMQSDISDIKILTGRIDERTTYLDKIRAK